LQDEHSNPFFVGDPQFGQKLYEDGIFSEHLGQERRLLFG
jgi:hypothetical protein